MMTSPGEGSYFTTDVSVYPNPPPPTREIIRERVEALEAQGRDDSFIVVDVGAAYHRLKQWRRLLPRVRPFYAMKCNPDVEFCSFLAQAGLGFDCASMREISQILDLGVHPSRIVFANLCKSIKHIRYAQEHNVDLMTFDDLYELIKIQKYCPKARLLLRIQSSKDHSAKHNLNGKFGCDPVQALRLMEEAKRMELNIVGVCFHVGGLTKNAKSYAATIRMANDVYTYGERLGFPMHILDIGGGYHGVDSETFTFKDMATTINEALDTYFPAARGTDIIAEPGRYFAAATFTVAVNVIAKKILRSTYDQEEKQFSSRIERRHADHYGDYSGQETMAGDNDSEITGFNYDVGEITKVMYTLNNGVFGDFNNVLTDFYDAKPILFEPPSGSKTFLSQLWGPTCDPLDSVVDDCRLPLLDIGQWFYFEVMGAYSICLGTTFNNMDPRQVTYVCDQTSWNEVNSGDSEIQSHRADQWKWFKHSPVKKQKCVMRLA